MQAGRCSLVITTRLSLAVLTVSSTLSHFVWSRFIPGSVMNGEIVSDLSLWSAHVLSWAHMSLDVSICPDFSSICVLSALVSSSLYLLFGFTFGLGSLLIWCDHSEAFEISCWWQKTNYSLHLCYNRDREDLTVFSCCSIRLFDWVRAFLWCLVIRELCSKISVLCIVLSLSSLWYSDFMLDEM